MCGARAPTGASGRWNVATWRPDRWRRHGSKRGNYDHRPATRRRHADDTPPRASYGRTIPPTAASPQKSHAIHLVHYSTAENVAIPTLSIQYLKSHSWNCNVLRRRRKFDHPNCMRLLGHEAREPNSCVRSSAQDTARHTLDTSGRTSPPLHSCAPQVVALALLFAAGPFGWRRGQGAHAATCRVNVHRPTGRGPGGHLSGPGGHLHTKRT